MSNQVENYLILRSLGFASLNSIILPYQEDSIFFFLNLHHVVCYFYLTERIHFKGMGVGILKMGFMQFLSVLIFP